MLLTLPTWVRFSVRAFPRKNLDVAARFTDSKDLLTSLIVIRT
jgi:hypothetical protein